MPLPDEANAPSASSLIKRFQAQIASNEANTPVAPPSFTPRHSVGSAPKYPPVSAPIDKNGKDHVGGEEVAPLLLLRSAGKPLGTFAAAQYSSTTSSPPPPVVFTKPSLDAFPPPIVTTTAPPETEAIIPTTPRSRSPSPSPTLIAKEGLSDPPPADEEPLEETLLFAPEIRDDQSPPPTLSPSPPPIPFPISTSPPPSDLRTPKKPLASIPVRSPTLSTPTASFLAKAKPKMVSPSVTPSRSRSNTPGGVKMSPTNSRTGGLEARNRSDSLTSNVSTSSAAKKATTTLVGRPRPSTASSSIIATSAIKPPIKPSSTVASAKTPSTRTPIKSPSSTPTTPIRAQPTTRAKTPTTTNSLSKPTTTRPPLPSSASSSSVKLVATKSPTPAVKRTPVGSPVVSKPRSSVGTTPVRGVVRGRSGIAGKVGAKPTVAEKKVEQNKKEDLGGKEVDEKSETVEAESEKVELEKKEEEEEELLTMGEIPDIPDIASDEDLDGDNDEKIFKGLETFGSGEGTVRYFEEIDSSEAEGEELSQ